MLAAALASMALIAPMQPPVVQTGPVTGITSSGATVSATVDGFGELTRYWFQYGTTTGYGGGTAPFTETDTAAIPVLDTLSGLQPSTTYHYRIVAQNQDGELHGADATFTTMASAPPPPVEPIGFARAPRKVRARARFTVTVGLRAPAALTIEILHKGKLALRLRLGQRTGTVHARPTAPRTAGVYAIWILAAAGSVQTDKLQLSVSRR